MITFKQARKIAEDEINRKMFPKDDSLIIIENEIIEKEYAWIFPFTSKCFFETGNINNAIGGNSPLFVSKIDGLISTYSTGLSIEDMIDEHEEVNKIWNLTLHDNIFSDAKRVLELKLIFNLSIEEISDYKTNNNRLLKSGSYTRLLYLKNELASKDIKCTLYKRITE
jgi:hypothetical protein